MKYFAAVKAVFLLAASGAAQTAPTTLLATPSTVVWGYYSAKAKPVLTIHSGATVRIQTLSTCGPDERLIEEGVAPSDIPSYNAPVYREVKDKGPRRAHPDRSARNCRSGARGRSRNSDSERRYRRLLGLQRIWCWTRLSTERVSLQPIEDHPA